MNKKDAERFKKLLIAEKARLEAELDKIGRRDPNTPGGWDATPGGMEIDAADENEVADKLEETEENSGIVTSLEKQLTEVNAALERVEKGTYGLDEKTGLPIDPKRLEANPSARFSIK